MIFFDDGPNLACVSHLNKKLKLSDLFQVLSIEKTISELFKSINIFYVFKLKYIFTDKHPHIHK